MIRGQAYIPLLVLIVGAKICRREGPRGLYIYDDADLVKSFPPPSSKISSVSVRGAKPGQDRSHVGVIIIIIIFFMRAPCSLHDWGVRT